MPTVGGLAGLEVLASFAIESPTMKLLEILLMQLIIKDIHVDLLAIIIITTDCCLHESCVAQSMAVFLLQSVPMLENCFNRDTAD